MMQCNIFREIVERKIAAEIVYEDDICLAFKDIGPQAPTHLLIIPKAEIRTHADIQEADAGMLGHLHLVAAQLARDLAITSYRLVINCGPQAGQTVPHLHLHLLAGRSFSWPPG